MWRGVVGYSRPECLLVLGNSQARKALIRKFNIPGKTRERGQACLELYPDIIETEDNHIADYGIDEHAGFECFTGGKTKRGGIIDIPERQWVEVGEFEGKCSVNWERKSPEWMVESNCEGPKCALLYMAFAKDGIFQDISLSEVYWACGKRYGLRKTLPKYWVGKCTWVRVVQATHILPMSRLKEEGRVKRTIEGMEPISFQDTPEEFATQSGVLAGFLGSIPIIGTGIQTSKNARWINYIYYNQLRFLNYTIDALVAVDHRINALAIELDANTKMTLENRMVLDWMLAKEGGVCAMVGENCCTYIPGSNNTSDAFEQAMAKLRGLRDEAHKNAGQEPGLDLSSVESFFKSVQGFFGSAWNWLENMLGTLGATIVGWILKVVLGITLVIAVCCCLVTCAGKVCSGTITRAVGRQLVVLGPMEILTGSDSTSTGELVPQTYMTMTELEVYETMENPIVREEDVDLHAALKRQYSQRTI